MTSANDSKWFNDWFNSTYYQVLYSNRNDSEAEFFIDNLITFFQQNKLIIGPFAKLKILDLACGQGRHSKYLAEKEFDVTGIDLSPLKISKAKKFERENLHFFEQDMREKFKENYFDIILNLFTSLGYFESEEDELKTFSNISLALKDNAVLVIDFLNAKYVENNLVKTETVKKKGITFHINKEIKNDYVLKNISIEGVTQKFQEKVRLYKLIDFENYLSMFNIRITKLFGSYDLSEYNEHESERLIIIAKK